MFWKRFKRDKSALIGLILDFIILFLSILGPFLAPYNPYDQDLTKRMQLPNKNNLLGKDAYGRDLFSRILYGARTTVLAGFFVVFQVMHISVTSGHCFR